MTLEYAGRRIGNLEELAFDSLGVVGIPFAVAIQDGFGNIQPGHFLQNGIHCRKLGHALVEIDGRGGSFDIARDAAFSISGEVEPGIEGCTIRSYCPC